MTKASQSASPWLSLIAARIRETPRMVAAGPIDEAVSTATVSRAFDHPSCVERRDGHWTARAARRARAVG